MIPPLIATWLLAVNVLTFLAYWRDKRAARRGGRRTPERTLFAMNIVGGFVGGWLGMLVLRHKTLHASFKVVQALATVLWVTALVVLIVGPRAA